MLPAARIAQRILASEAQQIESTSVAIQVAVKQIYDNLGKQQSSKSEVISGFSETKENVLQDLLSLNERICSHRQP